MDFRTVSKWLLPASLAVNVFLGVVVATHHHGHPPFRPGPPPGPEDMVEHMAESLSPADAAALRQAFAAQAGNMERAHRGHEDFHARLQAVLEAPVFDPEALRAALSEASRGHSTFDEAMAAAMVDAAIHMSPEGRRKLARGGGRPPP